MQRTEGPPGAERPSTQPQYPPMEGVAPYYGYPPAGVPPGYPPVPSVPPGMPAPPQYPPGMEGSPGAATPPGMPPGVPGYPPMYPPYGYPGYPYYPGYPPPMAAGAGIADQGQPTHTIWVGNLPEYASEYELRCTFAAFGTIEHIKVLPEKSCAFIRYARLHEAMAAHASSIQISGQTVKIGWGKPDTIRHDENGPPPCRNLWLGNIDPDITDQDIRREFGTFGPIERIRVLPQKSCAFINFLHLESALEAKTKMQGYMIRGRPIKINFGKAGEGNEEEGIAGPIDPSYLYTGPPQPPAPADDKQKSIIDKLAAAVVKNGPQMEEMVKEKQPNNPSFDFLKDSGQYNEYYRWKIFDLRQKQKDVDANPMAAALQARLAGGPPIVPPHQGPALTIQEREVLSSILDTLTPTKESIKKGKDFIMDLPGSASAVASFMCERVNQTPDWTAKLNMIYLANDVLHHSLKKTEGPEGFDDGFARAFQPYLASMMYSAHHNQAIDRQQKVEKLLEIWKTKAIFPATVLDNIEKDVRGEKVAHSITGVNPDAIREALHNAAGKYRNVSPPPNMVAMMHNQHAEHRGPGSNLDELLRLRRGEFGPDMGQGGHGGHGGPPMGGPQGGYGGPPGGHMGGQHGGPPAPGGGNDGRRGFDNRGGGGGNDRGGFDRRQSGGGDRDYGRGGGDRDNNRDRGGGNDRRQSGGGDRRGGDRDYGRDRYDDRDSRDRKRGRDDSRSRSRSPQRRRY